MREKLIIYLKAQHLEHPHWAVIEADGVVRRYAYQDQPQGLSRLAEGKEVIVIVPAEDVLLSSVKLPKMNRARLLQALPYALEDQLIGEIETLHFASGEYQPEMDLAVAVVAREKMQQWLGLLRDWGIVADRMISAVFAVPFVEDEWHVMVEESARLRLSRWQGVASDNHNLEELLRIALASAVAPPNKIIIQSYSQQPVAGSFSLSAPLEEELKLPDQLMIDMARYVTSTPSIDLLQGDYATKKSKFPKMDTMQRAVYYLSVALLVVTFLYPLGSLLILNQQTNKIKNQIAAIYKYHFPQASSVNAPKIRMEEKLHKLSAKIGENRLLFLLGQVGKAFVDSGGIKLKRMEYQGNQLTIELTATTADDFSIFTESLSKRGLQVRQQNATLAGLKINATLQVE